MSKKARWVAPVTALLLGLGGGAGSAVAASAEAGPPMRGGPGMMQNDDASRMGGTRPGQMRGEPGMMQDADASRMNEMRQGEARGQGMMRGGMMGMMGGGMMGGGMMNMMGSCPMMEAASGPDRKVMMQMHGEMMRAMGDIMIKYADKLDGSASGR